MRVRNRTMVIAGFLAVGIAGLIWGVVYLASPREPTYQGKTLSEWIVPFCRQTAKGLDAPGGPQHFEELQPVRQAVRGIGTNALPFLVARLNYRESRLHKEARLLMEKQPFAALRLTDPYVSQIRAIRALAILGPNAEPAIPSLAAQLTDATLSQHAVYALSGMSAKGIRALVEQYTNVPGPLRIEMALVIVNPSSTYRGEPITFISISGNYVTAHKEADQIQTNQIPADVLIEGFSQIAKDRASPFQTPAIQRLGQCGPLASNAVPVLVQILNDRNSRTLQSAIIALGRIGCQSEVVVTALTNLLSDPNPRISMAAASALRAFGYDVPGQSQMVHPIWPLAPGRTNQIRYY